MSGSRRQPAQDERIRDADRSRAALIDAAQIEFADKGFAGARVEAIAARAGLNKQLISYYFGGKQGLYEAIIDRWHAREREFDPPGTTLVELVLRYFEASYEDRELSRMFLRDAIDHSPADVEHEPDSPDLAGLRARQQAGEIGEDIDPEFLLLFLQAMVGSSVVFPAEAKRLTGLDPLSAEFRERAADQLSKIVARLR